MSLDNKKGNSGCWRGRGRGHGRGRGRGSGDPSQVQGGRRLSNENAMRSAEQEEVRMDVKGAFDMSFPSIGRVKERGRAFTIGGKQFTIVERTIGGLDDIVYAKQRDVWEHLPRGNAKVFVADATATDTNGLRRVGAVNGLRKFGYNDSAYGYPSEVTHVVAIEKENGECGHIAAFTTADDGQRYWIVGSKNVHIVLRYHMPKEDLNAYSGMRYGYALKIARLWAEMIARQQISEDSLSVFHETVANNGWTACFEAIFADSQHLVDYHGINELRFYALTEDGVPSEKHLCVDVRSAAAFYKNLGMYFSTFSDSVAYDTSPGSEYTALIDDIGRRSNSEGTVMYGYSQDGRIIRLWKEKSYPYVMERAAREAITNHKSAGQQLRDRLHKKLKMQKSELRQYFAQWEVERMPLLVRFAAWLQMTKVLTPHMQRDEVFLVRNRWLSLQREFAAEAARDNELIDVCDAYQPDTESWGDGSTLDVIKFVGAQGCGKSTLSRALFVLLTEAGHRPRWVNQDEAGNRNNFLSAIRQATHPESGVTHLLIDKMNLDERTNMDYKEIPQTLTVTWSHEDGVAGMAEECFTRVISRGSCHRTIRLAETLTAEERKSEEAKVRKFVSQAVRSCQMPQDDAVVVLDMGLEINGQLEQIWPTLQINGIHELPDLSKLDMNAAVDLSLKYETLLCKQPKAPIYAAIVLDNPHDVLRHVPAHLLADQNVQSQFHITTKYFVGDPDPIFFVQLAERLGSPITLTLLSVYSDPKGTAIVVRNTNNAEFPCANRTAHITIANRKGVPPKYSNELISAAHDADPERVVVHLPPGTTVRGVFQFR